MAQISELQDPLVGNMSKEAVIDYIRTYIHEIISESGVDKNRHTNEVLRSIIDGIKSMPDEQPKQVIRCKDCIRNNDCDIQYHAQAGDMFYCGMAESEVSK